MIDQILSREERDGGGYYALRDLYREQMREAIEEIKDATKRMKEER